MPRGVSGLQHRRLACVAVIWLLSAVGVHPRSHPARPSQHPNSTTPTVAAEASVSEDEQPEVATSSSHQHKSHQLEFHIDDRHPPAAAERSPSNATVPSPRCANREEWQECRRWSGKTHHRYLVLDHLRPREGVGASLMRVGWALDRALSFDLEPVFVGPLLAGHGTGDFGDWMGLTHNPLLAIQDSGAFERATQVEVPFPEGNDDPWFREQENRTSVVYHAEAMSLKKIKHWGIPVSNPSSDPRACPYVRQALRNIYWNAPETRGRCHSFLPEDHPAPLEVVVSRETTGYQPGRKRPWVLAVHVRRGDIIHFRGGFRNIPHKYFQAAVTSVLRGIAAIDPAAHVSVLVFSEGPETMTGFQLPDEYNTAVTWDIERESCLDTGLNCSQTIFLQTAVFETFDCFAAADVLVGSESSFSQAAAAVSTNVKIMIRKNQTMQDRVALDFEAAAKSGAVSSDEQLAVDTAIADWWYCSEEVQQSTETNEEVLAARRFYQTIDEGLSSP